MRDESELEDAMETIQQLRAVLRRISCACETLIVRSEPSDYDGLEYALATDILALIPGNKGYRHPGG